MRPIEVALSALFVLAMASLGWMAGGRAFEPHYSERMIHYGN